MFKKCKKGLRGLCRIFANHCIIPGLRHHLFRMSGLYLGKDAFLNMGVIIIDDYDPGLVSVGARASIAPNVLFAPISHPNHSFLNEKYNVYKRGPIIVENDVWIGAGVVIMPGIKIGEYSIIGSNSVVTKDVEPYSIMTGIPAQKRGDVRTRYKHLQSARL